MHKLELQPGSELRVKLPLVLSFVFLMRAITKRHFCSLSFGFPTYTPTPIQYFLSSLFFFILNFLLKTTTLRFTISSFYSFNMILKLSTAFYSAPFILIYLLIFWLLHTIVVLILMAALLTTRHFNNLPGSLAL